MAGIRLEYWSTLPLTELRHRVDEELSRATTLSFEENQLLDAALERLKNTREPINRRRQLENETENPVPAPEPKAEGQPEEKSVKKKAAKKPVAKAKAKAKAKSAAKGKTAKAAAKGNGKDNGVRSRIPLEAKVVKTGKENPYRPGSGRHGRVETVLKSSGQSVGTILKKPGMLGSTLNNMKKEGLIKIET